MSIYLCFHLASQVVHCCSNKHERDPVEYGPLQREHDQANHASKASVLQRAEIIGMTTTRAACIRDSLDSMQIKIGTLLCAMCLEGSRARGCLFGITASHISPCFLQ